MGHVYLKVRLSADQSKSVRMFVDTGATFSVIPPDLAKDIGVTPMKKKHRVELADGRVVNWKAGSAYFKIDGREAANIVLIGPVDEPVLGVEALEALGFGVDPGGGRLIPTRSWAVRFGGWRVGRGKGKRERDA